jgi:hypothetical protein
MPPWITTTKGFCGDRTLSDRDRETLKRWALNGTPQGQQDDKPVTEAKDWPLGQPDLIVTMPQPYTLAANALDATRCFLLPKPLQQDRVLKAVAFQASNPTIVRYVCVYTDTTGIGRKQEAISGAVGYFGFTGGLLPSPAGGIADWSPGSVVVPYPDGVGIGLSKNDDWILQARFHPTGRPETEQISLGLYFAKEGDVSVQEPVTLRLGAAELYMPKDSTAVLKDEFTLPTDVHLLEITPNSHIIGRTLSITAALPDGKSLILLNIPDWDVNWKQSYRLVTPILLPAQTKLTLNMTFDNTHKNRRITWKRLRSVVPKLEFMEEMSSVWLRLLPVNPLDRAKLLASLPPPRHRAQVDVDELEPEGQPPKKDAPDAP